MQVDVAIIGGGLAGLSAAQTLSRAGKDYVLLESSNQLGGRVSSDYHDGFILDRGFQIFLTAYPEAKRCLNYEKLNLCSFYKGALIWNGQRFTKVADPFRHPLDALCSLINDVGTPADKLRVARLSQSVQKQSVTSQHIEASTLAYLQAEGFSDSMIEQLFRPFFSGIFLERELASSSRLFTFLFKMFANGDATLPAKGMQAIPNQMAEGLEPSRLLLSKDVIALSSHLESDGHQLILKDSKTIEAEHVLMCTDAHQARKLLPQIPERKFNGTCCLYFEMPSAPISMPILMLNAVPGQLINNLCVPSLISSSYAPAGKHLLSVSTVGETDFSDKELETGVRKELAQMFGMIADQWKLLKIYKIPHALPRTFFGEMPPELASSRLSKGLYLAGDYCATPSINGALASGARAAEECLLHLQNSPRKG